jgi:glutamyl/glutaminyl-tRNA synthetase
LKEGKAYIDTSTADAIKAQRLSFQPSPCRDQDLAKNMELWEEMREGTEQVCVGAFRPGLARSFFCLASVCSSHLLILPS